jgi:hypothetical protein
VAIRLSLGKPHLGLRIRLRTLIAAIALFAVALWAAISIWSPTRRLSRLVRAGQPTYIRREAASALGHEISFREVDQVSPARGARFGRSRGPAVGGTGAEADR